jgi:NAD(P)-dependent dehydrogenase (short-subunit alcohol dehydrogenase family)
VLFLIIICKTDRLMGRSLSGVKAWIDLNVHDLTGKLVIVTGANSGIGYEAAKIFAARGATLIMACRNLGKSQKPFDFVRQASSAKTVELLELDLSDFKSIRSFASKVHDSYPAVDILVNNAGIMAVPYGKTVDGHELQFGTNHLGHFMLTGLLSDMVTRNPGSRVVTTTSIAHFNGRINFDDLNSEKCYNRMRAYRQSKMANLLFAYELQRKLSECNQKTISVAVHPGISATSIVKLPPLIDRLKDAVLMSAEKGCLPILMGATNQELKGGEYIGPDGFRQAFGYPAVLNSNAMSKDRVLAERLWNVSEEITGIKFNI